MLYEHLHNIAFLSKKGRKAPSIVHAFVNGMHDEVCPMTPKEVNLSQKLYPENSIDFLALYYPTNYFKASIILNLYPIPLATLVVIMVHQRIGLIALKSEVLFGFFFFLLFLLINMVLDQFLSTKIKNSRLYACSKAVARDHALNNSALSERMENQSQRNSTTQKRPSRMK